MASEIDRILDELRREHDGDPWHGSPLRRILDGLDAARAAERPLPGAHSIWELVLHLTAWKHEVRRRVDGAAAAEPAEGDWPPVPAATPANWTAALQGLEDAHQALLAAVARMPEARLSEPIKDQRDAAAGTGVSHYVLLHGIVQHDVYHSGQIALLKRALAQT